MLGAPPTLSAVEAREIERFIELAWQAQFDESLGSLSPDLRKERDIFDPVARGGRLRERLQTVGRLTVARPDTLDDVAVLSV